MLFLLNVSFCHLWHWYARRRIESIYVNIQNLVWVIYEIANCLELYFLRADELAAEIVFSSWRTYRPRYAFCSQIYEKRICMYLALYCFIQKSPFCVFYIAVLIQLFSISGRLRFSSIIDVCIIFFLSFCHSFYSHFTLFLSPRLVGETS